MTPEIGHFALVIALCLALVQGVLPLVGAQRGIAQWMAAARPIAIGQFVFLVISFACLTTAFIQNDFTVLYVANNSNTALPLAYRISAVWGAHEGSLLLWSLILSGWTVAVAVFSRNASTGALTFVEMQQNGGGVSGLDGALSVAVACPTREVRRQPIELVAAVAVEVACPDQVSSQKQHQQGPQKSRIEIDGTVSCHDPSSQKGGNC